MPVVRLPRPPQPADDTPATRPAEFSFDGRVLRGIEGEPLAASLLAAGERILSRSFRFHRPRGLMCSTGQCGWCECEVDGVPSVRTCRVPLAPGMVVRGEHAVPSVRRDVLGLLDVGARLVPPTFYHHRFLRPRRLRKAYLDVIRWFGGRGALRWHGDRRPAARLAREASCDVLVVGCGPGGVAAADAAAEAGARVIALAADTGWVREAPPSTGVRVLADTTALGMYDGVCAAVDAAGTWEIQTGQVIVATGSYDRVPSVPGADRPGVMAARLVARLVERDAILPGRHAVLIGSGRDLALAGSILRHAGASTSGPHATHKLRRITGRRGVRGVELLSDGALVTERTDLVVFGDRVPALELLLQAGAEMEWRGDHFAPVVDDDGRTSLAGFFAVGGAAGRSGDVAAAGRAGTAAAGAARSGASQAVATPLSRREPHLHEPTNNPVPGEAIVCFCEDVRAREIAAELDAGYGDPELLKRRTGALTGPCQGKYCLAAVACAAGAEGEWVPPTARPPLHPVRLAELAGAHPLAERPTST